MKQDELLKELRILAKDCTMGTARHYSEHVAYQALEHIGEQNKRIAELESAIKRVLYGALINKAGDRSSGDGMHTLIRRGECDSAHTAEHRDILESVISRRSSI